MPFKDDSVKLNQIVSYHQISRPQEFRERGCHFRNPRPEHNRRARVAEAHTKQLGGQRTPGVGGLDVEAHGRGKPSQPCNSLSDFMGSDVSESRAWVSNDSPKPSEIGLDDRVPRFRPKNKGRMNARQDNPALPSSSVGREFRTQVAAFCRATPSGILRTFL